MKIRNSFEAEQAIIDRWQEVGAMEGDQWLDQPIKSPDDVQITRSLRNQMRPMFIKATFF